jgi:hypothetical protein
MTHKRIDHADYRCATPRKSPTRTAGWRKPEQRHERPLGANRNGHHPGR